MADGTQDNKGSGSYTVRLDTFEGPMDLLLFLVRKNEVDIQDIPIALITKQYLEYLDLMQSLDLDQAGEFVAMAATLVHIKSRTLVPSDSSDEDAEDPRLEIVRPLIEYAALREAADQLVLRDMLNRDVFARDFLVDEVRSAEEEDLIPLSLFDLLAAYKSVLESGRAKVILEVRRQECSLEDKITEVLDRLKESGSLLFLELFTDFRRQELIVTFLALLELIRLGIARVFQHRRDGAIRVFLLEDREQVHQDAHEQPESHC